jgi:hypothetical protein
MKRFLPSILPTKQQTTKSRKRQQKCKNAKISFEEAQKQQLF